MWKARAGAQWTHHRCGRKRIGTQGTEPPYSIQQTVVNSNVLQRLGQVEEQTNDSVLKKLLAAFDSESNIHRVLRRGKSPVATLMSKSFAAKDCAGAGVDPIGPVGRAG